MQHNSIYKPFISALGLSNKHLQTIFPSFFRKEKEPKVKIEQFELSDGDFLDCYWNSKSFLTDKKPIVVLFHGLTGSFSSTYIQGMMNKFEKEGYTSVLMHFRGCSLRANRLPRSYHSGDTTDAIAWLTYISKLYPQNPIYAVGYSLGGNMLLKLLGECGRASLISKAVSISAPMDLEVSANTMNKGLSKIYQYRLMKELKETLLEKYKYHDMKAFIGIDENEVRKLKSFWEFDDVYTAPIHGFNSAKDYYEKCSSKQYLKDIEIDTLIIQSLDDPFMTPEILPKKDEISLHVEIEITSKGGHVGFVSGSIYKPKYWLEDTIISYFKIK